MRNLDLGLYLTVFATTAVAQSAPVATSAPRYLLDALAVTAGTIQDLELPTERRPFRFAVRLGEATAWVELEPVDVRSADYRLLVDTGTELIPLPRSAPVTWSGRIVGQSESTATARIVDGRLDAVLFGEEQTWGIASVHALDPLRNRTQHLVYAAADGGALDAKCGVKHAVPTKPVPPRPRSSGTEALQLVEIAADADHEFFRFHGSDVAAVEAAIASHINGVDKIYRRDVEIGYVLTRIIVRQAPRYVSSDMNVLLGEFATQWRDHHADIPRDVAHLWTGKGALSGIVGIAFLSVICSTGNGYGVNKAYYGNSAMNVGLISHELGHNWSAGHCNTTTTRCNIMCSSLGGCTANLNRFSRVSKDAIASFKASRGCLSAAPVEPTLTSIRPDTVEAFEPAVTLTGNSLIDVTSIQVGADTVTSFDKHAVTLEFTPPAPARLGTVPVSVTNPAGTSNGLDLTFVATDPARMTVPDSGGLGMPLRFEFGGDPDDGWFLLLSFDGLTFPFAGVDVLTNHTVFAQGTLSDVGLGSFDLPIPNRQSLSGLVFWTQLVAIDDSTGQLNDVTPARTTFLF